MPPRKTVSASRTAPVIEPPRNASQGRALTLVLKFVAFGFAGTIGFIVDMLATMTMLNFGLHPLQARAVGIVVALFATYVINRGLAFRAEASTGGTAMAAEGVRYAAVAIATSLLNWAVYAAVLAVLPGFSPLLAIVIGSTVAMVVSYLGYSRFAFRG
jgi:putative flippase GtrA